MFQILLPSSPEDKTSPGKWQKLDALYEGQRHFSGGGGGNVGDLVGAWNGRPVRLSRGQALCPHWEAGVHSRWMSD